MHILTAALALISILLFPMEGSSQAPHIELQSITEERLTVPTFVTNSHDGTGRLFVLEQRGRILVVEPNTRATTVFLDLTDKVMTSTERGLLGMTFHPQFMDNREFFVDYTRKPDGAIVVAQYKVSSTNPNVVEPGETVVLTIPHLAAEHNGGMIEFGSDGYLYISTGDGGTSYDPANNAQDLSSLLGKILRIDVDSPTSSSVHYSSPPDNPFYGSTNGRDEIFALGFRNPWRFSFDRATGEMYVGDVGQDVFEELDVVESGGNYGWRVFEGTLCTNKGPATCDPNAYISPILQYGHTGRGGTCSITGGYVYRGNKQSLPFGAYVYGDYCTGQIYMLYHGQQQLLLDTTKQITSFGEDEEGEIYVVGGTVDRIVNPGSPFATTTSFELNPGGTLSFESPGVSENVSVAHAQIQTNEDALRSSALAFIGFRKEGVLISESVVPATALAESGRVYVEIGGGHDTGIALVNPDMAQSAAVSFYFTDSDGNDFGESLVRIPAGGKIAAFLDEGPFYGPSVFRGTFTFDSSVPLSVIALEGIINQRAEFLTTTLPIVDLTTAEASPLLMPHVAAGGRWATDVILVNPTDGRLSGVMQFLPAQQSALSTNSPYSIPPRSSMKLSIAGQTSEIVGVVKVVPDQNNLTPSVAAIYTFTSGGILVSASGAAANAEADDFDIYSEISGQPGAIGSIQTGVAMANASEHDVDVRLDFVSLEGKSGAGGVLRLPAHGQIHSSILELPGAQDLPQPFQGTLHISSAAPIAAVAIRARYNERGDFLLSTTPPSSSDSIDPQDEAFIPQILDGGGYNTQIVIFGGTDEESSSGNIYFFDAEGHPIDPLVE